MSNPTDFSIIIPTYNRENFILNTLESVFAQTYPHYEVIIVDNCSTDKTVEVLKPLADIGKIRVIRNEQNYERAHSRNSGMKTARGDFLTFLDSDDFMYPDNLADAADFVKKNPKLKCFQNLYELIDEERSVLRRYKVPRLDDRIRAIVSGNFMSCIGNFIQREIYARYEFDTFKDLTGAEDWDFWLRVIADYEVGRIEKINSGILHHDTRTVNTKHFEVLEKGYLHMFQKFREDKHLSRTYEPYMKRIEANSYMYLATLANTGAFFGDARNYLKIARKKDSSITFSKRFLNTWRRSVFKLQIK